MTTKPSLLQLKILIITRPTYRKTLKSEKKKADGLGASGVENHQGNEIPEFLYCLPHIPDVSNPELPPRKPPQKSLIYLADQGKGDLNNRKHS